MRIELGCSSGPARRAIADQHGDDPPFQVEQIAARSISNASAGRANRFARRVTGGSPRVGRASALVDFAICLRDQLGIFEQRAVRRGDFRRRRSAGAQ